MAHDWRNYKTCDCGQPGCGSYRPFGGHTMRELEGHQPCGHIEGYSSEGVAIMCGSAGDYNGFCWSHRYCTEYYKQRAAST